MGSTSTRTKVFPHPYAGMMNPHDGKPAAIEAGAALYARECVGCHGASGRGDGVQAMGMDPRPSDLTGHTVEHPGDYVYWRIAEGGVPEEFGSAMPPWKDRLSEDAIWQLVSFIRSLAE